MADSPLDIIKCKARVNSLVDVFFAEINCDAERFEALVIEFSEATQSMQDQLTGQAEELAEWHAERMSDETLSAYAKIV